MKFFQMWLLLLPLLRTSAKVEGGGSLWGYKVFLQKSGCEFWMLRDVQVLSVLKEFSVCVDILKSISSLSWTAFWYLGPGQNRAELGLGARQGRIYVWLSGRNWTAPDSLGVGLWHSLCLTWSCSRKKLQLFVDGGSTLVVETGPETQFCSLSPGGSLSLGAAHYYITGHTPQMETGTNLQGHVSLFRVWSKTRSPDLLSTHKCTEGDALHWTHSVWNTHTCAPERDDTLQCAWSLYEVKARILIRHDKGNLNAYEARDIAHHWLRQVLPPNIYLHRVSVSPADSSVPLSREWRDGDLRLRDNPRVSLFEGLSHLTVIPSEDVRKVQDKVFQLLRNGFHETEYDLYTHQDFLKIYPIDGDKVPVSTSKPTTAFSVTPKPTTTPSRTSSTTPVTTHTTIPGRTPGTTPTTTPSTTPTTAPGTTPGTTPGKTPATTHATAPTTRPVTTPATTPTTTPGTTPGTTPSTIPGSTPRATPGTTPTTRPATTPTTTPATTPGTTPTTTPSTIPSSTPRATPGTTPRTAPTTTPSKTPSTIPGSTPRATPSTTLATTPSTTPSTIPGSTPATTPSTTPSTIPGSTPTTTPSTTPTTTPGTTPSTTPSTTPATTHRTTPSTIPGSTPRATPTTTPSTTHVTISNTTPATTTCTIPGSTPRATPTTTPTATSSTTPDTTPSTTTTPTATSSTTPDTTPSTTTTPTATSSTTPDTTPSTTTSSTTTTPSKTTTAGTTIAPGTVTTPSTITTTGTITPPSTITTPIPGTSTTLYTITIPSTSTTAGTITILGTSTTAGTTTTPGTTTTAGKTTTPGTTTTADTTTIPGITTTPGTTKTASTTTTPGTSTTPGTTTTAGKTTTPSTTRTPPTTTTPGTTTTASTTTTPGTSTTPSTTTTAGKTTTPSTTRTPHTTTTPGTITTSSNTRSPGTITTPGTSTTPGTTTTAGKTTTPSTTRTPHTTPGTTTTPSNTTKPGTITTSSNTRSPGTTTTPGKITTPGTKPSVSPQTADIFFKVIVNVTVGGSEDSAEDTIKTWLYGVLSRKGISVLNFHLVSPHTATLCSEERRSEVRAVSLIHEHSYSCVFQMLVPSCSDVEETQKQIHELLDAPFTNGTVTLHPEDVLIAYIQPGVCPQQVQQTRQGLFVWVRTPAQHTAQCSCHGNHHHNNNNNNIINKSSAYRQCVLSADSRSVWMSPELQNCPTVISTIYDLEHILVTNETVGDVLQMIKDLLQESASLDHGEMLTVLTKLQDVLNVSAVTPDLAEAIVSILSSIVSSDSDLKPFTNSILNITESVGDRIPGSSGVLSVVAPALALSVVSVASETHNLTFGVTSGNNRPLPEVYVNQEPFEGTVAFISLPPVLLSSAPPDSSPPRVQFQFYGVPALFKDADEGKTLNTYVVSASVINAMEPIENLKEPVVVTLHHLDTHILGRDVQCVFWDFNKNRGFGGWSQRGCWKSNVTPEYTTCLCDHLTHFGVLLDVSRTSVDEENERILTVITYVGCGLSSFFLGVTVLTYSLLEKLRTDYPSQILLNLSVALLGLNLVFLTNSWFSGFSVPGLCVAVAVAQHYFLLASFSWMFLEAVNLYLALVKVFNVYVPSYILKFCIAGWGVPLVICCLVLVLKQEAYAAAPFLDDRESQENLEKFCWIQDDLVFFVSVLGFAAVVLLCNGTVFLVVLLQMRKMRATEPAGTRRCVMKHLKGVASLTFLLGLTWAVAFFTWTPAKIPLLYLFSIFNSLQGFFIFIFHCLMKENVRKQWRVNLCLGPFKLEDHSDLSHTVTAAPKPKPKPPQLPTFPTVASFRSSSSNSTQSSSLSSDSSQRHVSVRRPNLGVVYQKSLVLPRIQFTSSELCANATANLPEADGYEICTWIPKDDSYLDVYYN